MKHMTLAVACVGLMAASALGDWTEDFQSYAVGSLITGQGGWTGWDGDTTFLAAVVDDPAGTAGNKVLKAFQNNDMVQQYSGYTSGAWVYKAKQYIPSGKLGNTYFILMNNYYINGAKGWGLSLCFDLTNGVVWDDEGCGGGVAVAYDQWAEIRVEIDLESNFRTTYYNGTKLAIGPWYDPGDANQAKAVAAVDLWADAAGDPVYYDDLSLTPGTPAPVRTDDLTTYPGREARYLVSMGRDYGDTSVTGTGMPSGLYEIVSAGGNQNPWWRLNEGNPRWSSVMVTFYGASPDYFGYEFKLPATVKQITWWNACFIDGGTFADTPEVQYLDAVKGTWKTITDVTWDEPYSNVYGVAGHSWGTHRYVITLNNPPKAIWGIRLFGATQPGVDDSGDGVTGFLGTTEMTLYGDLEVAPLDLSNNLALGAATIASDSQYANWAALTNGATELGNYDTTWSAANSAIPHEDFIGVTWPTPQNNVAAMGVVFNGFVDGGYFDPCKGFRIEYTTDGANWTPVTGLDLGRYTDDWITLRECSWGPDVAFLFRFDAVSGITGLRIIGRPDGYSADADGFIGACELEVFANKVTGASAASVKPGVGNRIVSALKYLWTIVAL